MDDEWSEAATRSGTWKPVPPRMPGALLIAVGALLLLLALVLYWADTFDVVPVAVPIAVAVLGVGCLVLGWRDCQENGVTGPTRRALCLVGRTAHDRHDRAHGGSA